MHFGRRIALGVALLLAAATASVRAENFEVDPVTVTLAPGAKFADVTIRNSSPHAMRFSVRTYVWTQSPTDDVKLQETDDLLAFPDVFDVPAQSAQRIRVGLTAPAHATEAAYRLFINEVPQDGAGAAHGAQLRIVTHVGIPIFAQAATTQQARPELAQIRQDGRTLAFGALNAGQAHQAPSTAHVTLKDTAGHAVWTHDQSVWYVLPGSERSIRVAVPAAACKSAASAEVGWLNGAVKTASWNGALCTH